MSAGASRFLVALRALVEAGVDFIVVGVGGINFYASEPGDVVVTQDLDVLLAPAAANLRAALDALHARGFAFRAGGEPFVDLRDDEVLRTAVRQGASFTASDDEGAHLDLMLSASGLRFEDLATDARAFHIGDLEVRVGRLEKLLHSKELTGRAKDLEFLRLFAARLRDDPDTE